MPAAKRKRARFSKPGSQPVTPNPAVLPAKEDVPAAAADEVSSSPIPEPPTAVPEEHLEDILLKESGESDLNKKNKRLYAAGIVFFVCIVVMSVALYVLSLNTNAVRNQPKSKAAISTPAPSPTPVPEELTIEVLNGSGVPGAAAGAAKQLTEKGYHVTKTGNALKEAESKIFVASGISESSMAMLLNDVNALFGISSSSGMITGSTASARLVLGVK